MRCFVPHTYELYHRHWPNILIIIEPCIADARAQGVIDMFPYFHSLRVDPAGFFGDI